MQMKQKLVVVGNGMAGIKAVEALIAHQGDRYYDITVIGEESHPNYNRIMLSPLLADETAFNDIVLNPLSWYRDQDIHLHLSDPVISIDRKQKNVICYSGIHFEYDQLILATGSKPASLPLHTEGIVGVMGFRTLDDVHQMQHSARDFRHAVIVGGGLLGLEAAAGLAKKGMHTTLLHRSGWILNRQLDEVSAGYLQQELEGRGIHFRLRTQIRDVMPLDGRVHQLELDDGSLIHCDLLITAAGITPEINLAKTSGLAYDRGILVNDQMQTTDSDIYALGECCQHRGECYGLVAPVWEQAEILGQNLALRFAQPMQAPIGYQGTRSATRLKISGIDLFSAGEVMIKADNSAKGGSNVKNKNNAAEVLCWNDPAKQNYRRLIIRDNRITGVLLYGDIREGNTLFELMQQNRDITPFRQSLLFGGLEAALKQQPKAAESEVSGDDNASLQETAVA